jgi:hypothetical protein
MNSSSGAPFALLSCSALERHRLHAVATSSHENFMSDTGGVAPCRQRLVTMAFTALAAAVLGCATACGGGGESRPVPTMPLVSGSAQLPSKPIPDPQREAALALYEAGRVVLRLGSYVLWYLPLASSNEHCIDSGAAALRIDGAPEAKWIGGSHSLSATFNRCRVDGLVGTTLNGALSGAYSYAGEYDYGAQLSVSTLSGSHLAYVSDLYAVIVDGTFTLSSVSTGAGTSTLAYTETLSPASGLILVNASTGHALTFGSGSYASTFDSASRSGHHDFNGLRVEINGANYTIDGSMHWTVGNSGLTYTSGTVLITSGGAIHASISADPNSGLRVEVLIPLERF